MKTDMLEDRIYPILIVLVTIAALVVLTAWIIFLVSGCNGDEGNPNTDLSGRWIGHTTLTAGTGHSLDVWMESLVSAIAPNQYAVATTYVVDGIPVSVQRTWTYDAGTIHIQSADSSTLATFDNGSITLGLQQNRGRIYRGYITLSRQ